ncbi:MAG: Pls/PosA family non-ribosomal peptide synthetase [Verrucomicrobiota bacterium]
MSVARQTDGAAALVAPATVPELLRPELLHELFEETARTYPGRMALMCRDERMTYGELDAKANQLAHFLRSRNIGRGALVGLLLPRSMDVFPGLLAILKAGAAYVPLDPDYPADRVQYILADCAVAAIITVSALKEKLGPLADRAVCLDTDGKDFNPQPATRLERDDRSATPEDVCYVIYTSGSTGRPKGVQIEHRSACHLVRAEGMIFHVRPEDRVYQGFSIAFDASVEEVWLAFYSGATLVVGTRDMTFSGPALSQKLTEAGVTVFSTVPTQLAMMVEEVPTVRLLIVGGEACPADLVRRWARTGRRMVNTYGPTEATVIATWGDVRPDEPVTIGRAVPNYHLVVLNEQLQPVSDGQTGELCIGGIGLARGYIGRADLTAEKFIPNPVPSGPSRLYRTGDLVRRLPSGDFEFLGRIDSQVKLRGYRIELSEIESVLLTCPGVQAAAVTVREDVPGVPQLVGYIVSNQQPPPAEADLKRALKTRLAAYMVPACIETLDRLPMLPSGKVDRKSLPAPRPRQAEIEAGFVAPRNPLEEKLARVWEEFFRPMKISVTADFFHDLGGHSLLAAQVVSELRQAAEFRTLSILDLYQQPTIEKLAAHLAQTGSPTGTSATTGKSEPKTRVPRIPKLRHFLCGTAQFFSFYLVLAIFSMQWVAPYFTYAWMNEQGYERWQSILGAFTALVALYPGLLLLAILVKWLVIGKIRPGEYPLWGGYYFRFWFVNTIQSSVPVNYLEGTPLLNLYYRLMGARIGRNVHLASPCFVCHDLVEVGDDTSVGTEASFSGHHIENGKLVIGKVRLGRDCFVGTRALARENTVLEDGAALEDLSLLPSGMTIPAGERWAGSPARKVAADRPAQNRDTPQVGPLKRAAFVGLHLLGVVLFPACVLAAVLPGMIVMNTLNYNDNYAWYLMVAPIIALSFVVLLALEIAAVKWLLLGRVKPGRYPVHSWFYVRKWFVDQLLELSLDFLGPLYASIYLAPWYKLMGAKLGDRAEISTASFISPDLLELGEETFIADSVSLGAARVERDYITLGVNRVGKRSFIGNSALMPPGTHVGDNSLVGCLSMPPDKPEEAARDGATWLGVPPILLPQRQTSSSFSAENTFQPNASLRAQRAAIEFIRVILPVTGFVALTSLMFTALVWLEQDYNLWQILLIFPLIYAACGVLAIGLLTVFKWLLVGRYRPGERPLWNHFVWRNELLNAVHDHCVIAFIACIFLGTPFICWFFRLLGANIGRRVYLDTTDITEFDLVRIGDEAEINADATLQTHLFEDRVMKMSHVDIGEQCTVGSATLVLYDTRMEPGAQLNDLSLLMKGETLTADTFWEGIPARPPAGR